MKILQLSAVKNWGGGGNHLENLCYELSKTNPEINNIIVVAENGQFHERLKKSNFNFYTLPLVFKIDPRAIFKLIKICKKENIDLVHIHGSTSLTLAVIAYQLSKLPPFIFSKKTSFPIKSRKRTLYKYNHPNIKKILCVSENTKEISKKAILDLKKLETIYHGTRIDNKTKKTPFLLRTALNIPENHHIVGNIGNHIPAKDLGTFIDTVDYLVNKKNHKNLFFVQIGTFTNLTAAIKDKVKNLNLEKYVHFMGYLPNASNFMAQFDVLLVTSKSEGIPQVIYEAFYHKIPVVSTNVGGIPEIITHEVNGFLTPKQHPKLLAKNISVILENEQIAKDFAEKNFKKLMAHFTTEFMAVRTLEEYKKALNLT